MKLHIGVDSAYASQGELIQSRAPAAQDQTNQRVRGDSGIAGELERICNRIKSGTRARVEHVFAVFKRLWGFNKVRYRGLAKNATRSFVALGLANIYLARRPLYGKSAFSGRKASHWLAARSEMANKSPIQVGLAAKPSKST